MRSDVIAAISTPPGKGGVAIIRISGYGTFEIAQKVFTPLSGRTLTSYPPRTAIYGYVIKNKGERVDDALITLFPEGSSYTGEPTAEISCHGGVLVSYEVLKTALVAGAVPAEAGEFTRRAFLHGRITLSDAEAIGNLLEAKSEAQLALASGKQRRLLNREIDSIYSSLNGLLASMYARIDYPEEDLGELSDESIIGELKGARQRIERLLASYSTGRAINEGITVALVGRPNTGKSSLYNLLLGEDRAIVTDIAGTTRDLLETDTSIGSVTVRLIDTAGIRQTEKTDQVERIGIERAEERLMQSDLVIALYDLSSHLTEDDLILTERLRSVDKPIICILNKSDRERVLDSAELPDIFFKTFTASVKQDPEGTLALIRGEVESMFLSGDVSPNTDPIISSLRQKAALSAAEELINSAILAMETGLPPDCASSDIEIALGAIGEIDGRAVSDTVVNEIFSRFCVGK